MFPLVYNQVERERRNERNRDVAELRLGSDTIDEACERSSLEERRQAVSHPNHQGLHLAGVERFKHRCPPPRMEVPIEEQQTFVPAVENDTNAARNNP